MDFGSFAHALRREMGTAGTATRLAWGWGAIGILSTAALLAISIAGPISLGNLRAAWLLIFAAGLIALAVWGLAYCLLFQAISASSGSFHIPPLWPFLLLSFSVVPDAAVVLSGKLSYALIFDEDLFRAFRYLAALIIGSTVVVQEVALASAAYGGPKVMVARAWGAVRDAFGQIGRSLRALSRPSIPAIALLAVLAVGSVFRLASIDSYHGGDMDVILSITYNTLGWPPVAYYHNYAAQTWVYNHFPLFPIALAPFYWLSENVLHFPTPWTAKLLVGAADVVIAVLLYRIARGRWRRAWGLIFASAWFLSPLVIRADDHPIAFAIALALLALASLDTPWLCGLTLALGVASRNEVAFLSLPLLVHFAWKRPIRQSVAFFAVSGTALALVCLPFVLFDPAAMDYALRGQLQRDASSVQSMLFTAVQPYLSTEMSAFLRYNPSLPAIFCTGLVALLALREHRVERVVLLVALVYLVTLPLLYDRYLLFAFGAALYYSARYSRPLPAVILGLLTVWSDFPYGSELVLGLLAIVAIVVVARPVTDRAEDAADPQWQLERTA